jgi:hypothetical protein
MGKKPRPDRYKQHWTILLVENSSQRGYWFNNHIPENVRFHQVLGGQTALGVLRRMRPNDYSAIMLDCDLAESVNGVDNDYDGVEVAKSVVQYAPKHLPVRVHSQDPAVAARMVMVLESNGFSVTRMPFKDLTPESFKEWLMDVEEEIGIEWT